MSRKGYLLLAALLLTLLTACTGQTGTGAESESGRPAADAAAVQGSPAPGGNESGAGATGTGERPPTPAGAEELQALKPGETVQVAGLSLTLQGVDLLAGTDGTPYLTLQMRLENNGPEAFAFASLDWFRLEAPDGRRYRPSQAITAQAGLPLDAQLLPGLVQEGWVGFAAPVAPGPWLLHVGPDGTSQARFRFTAPEASSGQNPGAGELEPTPAEPEPSPAEQGAEGPGGAQQGRAG